MLIKIGTFSKEINSTKVPNLTTEIDVKLKDNVSLISPVIQLRESVYDTSWNYCYIPKWGRYYFLHDPIIRPGGVWDITLALDVLASWRTYIRNSTAYVSRSASNYSNKLPDSTWSHTSDYSQSSKEIDCGLNTLGCFILFTASDDATGAGSAAIPSVSAYVLSTRQLRDICNYMFSGEFFDSFMAGQSETYKVLGKTFFNPFQYVLKCMWFPFTLTEISHEASKIGFGWFDSNIDGGIVTANYVTKEFSFTVGSYSTWIDRDAGWTKNHFYMPGFGQMEISPEYQGKTLTGTVITDLTTGESTLFLKDASGNLVQSATGKWGCDIQLSGLYTDYINNFGSKGAAIFNGIRAGIGGAVGASKQGLWQKMGAVQSGLGYEEANLSELNTGQLAEDVVKGAQGALQPSMSTCGSAGTRAILQRAGKAILTTIRYTRYEDIHDRLGGVCNQILSLSTLSGYTEVVNPHVECPATSNEISMINSFLSGGFYLE